MDRCLKNVEKPLVLGLHLGVTVYRLSFRFRFNFGFRFWVLGLGFVCRLI